jgi:hypothetical protein
VLWIKWHYRLRRIVIWKIFMLADLTELGKWRLRVRFVGKGESLIRVGGPCPARRLKSLREAPGCLRELRAPDNTNLRRGAEISNLFWAERLLH